MHKSCSLFCSTLENNSQDCETISWCLFDSLGWHNEIIIIISQFFGLCRVLRLLHELPLKVLKGGGLLQDPVNGSHLRRKYSYELIGLWVLKSFAFALGGTTSGHELTIPIPRLHPPLHFLLTGHLWCCTGGIWQFAWNMAKTETEACSSGSRTNATRQRNCVISRGVACGSNIISICKWRSFTNDLPSANLLLHTFTHSHTHTRHTYEVCWCSFMETPFSTY